MLPGLLGETDQSMRFGGIIIVCPLRIIIGKTNGLRFLDDHADEIADLYFSLAQDLANASNEALTDLITKATKTAVKSGDFTLPPSFKSEQNFAILLRLGLEGVKKEIKTIDEFESLAFQLIRALI